MANITTPSSKVPCTFKNCEEVFDSEQQMRRHKMQDQAHYYCVRCNVDCDTPAALFIHNIASSKHIVCPVCGVEFRSAGGRDVHIQTVRKQHLQRPELTNSLQNHHRDQNIICTGCGDKFVSGAGMIQHIESNSCAGITGARLTQEQVRRSMINASLKPTNYNTIPEVPVPPTVQHYATSTDDGDDGQEGGVRLNIDALQSSFVMDQPSSIATEADDLSTEKWPALIPTVTSAQNIVQQHIQMTLPIREKGPVNVPPTPSTPTTVSSLPIGPDDLISFDEDISDAGNSTAKAGTFNKPLARDTGFGIGDVDPNALIRQGNAQWDPKKFFSGKLGRYVCTCGNSFRRVEDFEKHIVTEREMEGRDEWVSSFLSFAYAHGSICTNQE